MVPAAFEPRIIGAGSRIGLDVVATPILSLVGINGSKMAVAIEKHMLYALGQQPLMEFPDTIMPAPGRGPPVCVDHELFVLLLLVRRHIISA